MMHKALFTSVTVCALEEGRKRELVRAGSCYQGPATVCPDYVTTSNSPGTLHYVNFSCVEYRAAIN